MIAHESPQWGTAIKLDQYTADGDLLLALSIIHDSQVMADVSLNAVQVRALMGLMLDYLVNAEDDDDDTYVYTSDDEEEDDEYFWQDNPFDYSN